MATALYDGLSGNLADRLPEWTRLFQDLVRQRSVFEAEHGIVELIERRLTDRGIAHVRVPHGRERLERLPRALPPFSDVAGRASLAARVYGTGGGRSLIFNIPIDIVPEGDLGSWHYPPYEARIEDGRLYGRGAFDDKAGVAIALAVIDLLAERQPLRGDVIFHFVLEDETTGNGTLLCLDAGHLADAAVIIDGTRSTRAIDRQVGTMSGALRLRGRPASISVSHMGTNAIELLSELLLALRALVFAQNESRREPWTRFPNPYQFVTRRITGDSSSATLPEYAEAEFWLTFPPPSDIASMRALVENEVRRFADARSIDAPSVQWHPFAFEPSAAGSPALNRMLQDVARRLAMPKIDIGPSTGWSDMRHFTSYGIPCLLYGPGEGYNPHRADEYYELRDLPRMIEFYRLLAESWCC